MSGYSVDTLADEPVNAAVFLAHPDDETWVSGLLSQLSERSVNVVVIYAANGGKGRDLSGRDLSGSRLVQVRAREADVALAVLNVKRKAVFWGLQDGELKSQQQLLRAKIAKTIVELRPALVVSFDEGGMTGHSDHVAIGNAVRSEMRENWANTPLWNVVMSEERASVFNGIAAKNDVKYRLKHSIVSRHVDLVLDVSAEGNQRVLAATMHKTQFPWQLLIAWREFVMEDATEEYRFIGVTKGNKLKLKEKLH